MISDIQISGFSLAKGSHLTGNDAYISFQKACTTFALICDVGDSDDAKEIATKQSKKLLTQFQNRPKHWDMRKTFEHLTHFATSVALDSYVLIVIEGNRLYGLTYNEGKIILKRKGKLTTLSQPDTSAYYFENIIRPEDKILLCNRGLYETLNASKMLNGIDYGAHFLVKRASELVYDNLPYDTTAMVIEVHHISPISELLHTDLEIPKTLDASMQIDRYSLQRPTTPDQRSWIATAYDDRYILKFPTIEANQHSHLLEQFVKEVWNAKRLKAGFFPKGYVPKERSKRYYVLEYIEGKRIDQLIKQKPLPSEEAVELGKFLLNMSQFLLQFDLVHAAIHPENMLRVDTKGQVHFKMRDFEGISELFSRPLLYEKITHLSPIMMQGDEIDESEVIYSIGITLYQVLSNQLPYSENDSYQHFLQPPKSLVKQNPTIPIWLESIIFKAISAEREKRYKHYSEMLYELEHPNKVKPYIDKEISLIQREPVLVYKTSFIIMLILNVILLIKLIG